MASKKDFSAIGTGRVYTAIEQATSKRGQQGTASPQEAAERAATGRTQGRKGCKATRINMAFTTENHQFIKTMAAATGRSMTEFANLVITAYRSEHPELVEQANALISQINNTISFSEEE